MKELILFLWAEYGQGIITGLAAIILRWIEKGKIKRDYEKRMNGAE